MKKLIAVIGPRNSGKSTIIQSLTGCKTRTWRGIIVDRASGKEIVVIASSPQERAIGEWALRRLLRRAKRARKCEGLVIAIQPNHPTRRLGLEKILNIAASLGFKNFAFLLNPTRNGRSHDVRGTQIRLGSVRGQMLDARRFAHVNASIIREVAGLF